MTVRSLAPYRDRVGEALRRIHRAADVLSKLLPESESIDGPILNGQPQWIRDLDFIADEFEALVTMARRKAVSKETQT